MYHLPFTLTAYFFNAISVLTNKFLLQKTIPDPLIYIFYVSALSLLMLLALPFTHIPTATTLTIASASTLFWTLGAYFMFKALKSGQVSRVIPVIGTLIPLILLIFAFPNQVISSTQILAILILICGMIFLTITDWQGKMEKNELFFEILSAFLFAFSYLLLRQAYLQSDFFSVLVWSRLILLPLGMLMFVIPKLRKKIVYSTASSSNLNGGSGLVFLGGQVSGVFSELLLLFSISLANPALVNSLAGTQYIFLFIFTLLLSKKYPKIFSEKYTLPILTTKFLGIGLIATGLYLLTV